MTFPLMFISVNQGEEAVVERLGLFERIIGPGVHFLIPFMERLRGIEDPKNPKKLFNNGKIPISPQVFNFPKDDRAIFTKNNKQVRVNADVVYQIDDPIKAVYEVAFLFEALNQLIYGIIQKRIIEGDSATERGEGIFAPENISESNERGEGIFSTENKPKNNTEKANAENEILLIKKITADMCETCNGFTKKWGVTINEFKIRRYTDQRGIRHDFE